MVAPGATPATIPVCMIAMPSVSREHGGTVRSVSDSAATIVGRDRDAADEQEQRPSAGCESTK